MLEMLQYTFMQRAFIVGILIAITLPCIGLPIILKRLSTIGDTLSHASLAGVSIGLCFGINPILGSVVACIVAGLSIEIIRKKLKSYEEISTVIILGACVGLVGIFTSFIKNSNSISSYLFGSIITISDLEFYLIIFISFVVMITYYLLYDSIFLNVFNPKIAEVFGVKTNVIDFIFTLLAGITISIAAKTIGSLIVSSLLVLPCISAMQIAKTYKKTLILSIILSLIYVVIGLSMSYYFNLKPGSVIVLIAVIVLLLTLVLKKNKQR